MNENRFYFSFILFLFFTCTVFAQEKTFVKYTVLKGETITQIAIKYKVTPYDIYKLNPDSQTGIKENDVLIIPIPQQINSKPVAESPKPKSTSLNPTTHIVKPKETFYSISRDYNIDVEDLKNSNLIVFRDGLKIGETITIPNQNGSAKVATETVVKTETTKNATSSEKTVYHIVEPKETKFGISKQYGITIEELERRNPEIVNNLPVGYKLIISGSNSYTTVEKPKPVTQEIIVEKTVQTETVTSRKKTGYANYEVRPDDTIYSLSQMLNISQEELIALNPRLKDGLKVGMILKVPGQGSIIEVKSGNSKFTDLSQSINNLNRKKLVMLIPFNAAKMQSDTLKTISVRLKKEAFLNLTLDYYSGVLMAIDSAKTLGLNIDVKIFDSQESKMSSDVVNIVKNNNLQNADAIIGPFYQQYVEQVAALLKEKNVPVISPLSKETGTPYNNLYQTIPPNDVSKKAMFDYMIANNGNIVVVISPKKNADRVFITTNYPSAKIVQLNENGDLNDENLKALFVPGKTNYVVLDSEKTSMILSTTNVMLNEFANYKLQLVIIESNDTLDFEEISLKRLTILKMLYPSISVENNSPEAVAFKNAYKKINKVFPSQYAVRGFDVTFDTMLRLSQSESFEMTAQNIKTQQIESKFEYVKDTSSEFVNKGVYILEYQEDYSVKQVN